MGNAQTFFKNVLKRTRAAQKRGKEKETPANKWMAPGLITEKEYSLVNLLLISAYYFLLRTVLFGCHTWQNSTNGLCFYLGVGWWRRRGQECFIYSIH